MKIPVCLLYLLLACFRKMSAAFDGVYNVCSWGISHELVDAFMKYGMSMKNAKGKQLEREISETLCNIQNSFHSPDNIFTALERKHDEIVGKINSGMKETKVHKNIVRIIILLKKWLLQIEEGYCMGTKDKKHDGITGFGNKIDQSSINSPSFIVFHYYLVWDVDVAYYTTTNALFNAEIKTLQFHCIFFEDYSNQ